ncbi:hypothetical protein HF086_012370 [Spodoptera exigua]|uniref:Uncharacterized protein n=1 Tax=Spodoptera exigua TaxID=7107 RepID=A0A922M9R2_SPOEX|nr:hypothetical protein HF086_012370 [Spodoptera exigua]
MSVPSPFSPLTRVCGLSPPLADRGLVRVRRRSRDSWTRRWCSSATTPTVSNKVAPLRNIALNFGATM